MRNVVIALVALICVAATTSAIVSRDTMPEVVTAATQENETVDSVQTGIDSEEAELDSVQAAILAANQISDEELFERTVGIIKKYESLHKAHHYPLIGYGHKVRKGDKYRPGVELSEREADKLLRKDLRMYVDMCRDYGTDAYLLAALAYNCGHGRVNRSRVIAKLRNGDRNIREAYLSIARAGGKFRRQLYERRIEEFDALFVHDESTLMADNN